MVTWVGLVLSLLFLLVPIAISVLMRLGIGRDLAVATLRMGVQLAIVGVLLVLVISPERSIWWSWLWVALMLGYAANVTARRAPAVPGLGWLALLAFLAAAVVTTGILFGLGVVPMTGRTVVPLLGMMVGNSMTATVLAARRVVEEFQDKSDQVEAHLALGHDGATTSRVHVRTALRAALLPQVERTKAVGIVFLPGAMTGLILAGASPQDAVMIQAIVMLLVLAAAATTTVIIAVGAARRMITPDLRLAEFVTQAQT